MTLERLAASTCASPSLLRAARRVRALPACLVLLAACAGTPPSQPALAPPPPPVPTETLPGPAALPLPVASAVELAPSAPPPPPPPPPPLALDLTREIEAPATMLAFDDPPHVAALAATAVWIHDAHGWRSEPLPPSALKDPPPRLSVFYGRDRRVRVVGRHATERGLGSVYLRSKPRGLVDGGGEIGRFADGRGGLVAVLGEQDPEIVCRLGDACVVKRRTGWTFIPIPPDLERVTLGDDVGWALGGQLVYRLDDRFHPVGERGSWAHADHLFALRDRAFVIESDAGRIHAWDGSRWTTSPSPVPHPRAMWGAARDALWLVGDGIAYFDGHAWRVAEHVPGSFEAVLGRSRDDVWIAGSAGVFRVRIRA